MVRRRRLLNAVVRVVVGVGLRVRGWLVNLLHCLQQNGAMPCLVISIALPTFIRSPIRAGLAIGLGRRWSRRLRLSIIAAVTTRLALPRRTRHYVVGVGLRPRFVDGGQTRGCILESVDGF